MSIGPRSRNADLVFKRSAQRSDQGYCPKKQGNSSFQKLVGSTRVAVSRQRWDSNRNEALQQKKNHVTCSTPREYSKTVYTACLGKKEEENVREVTKGLSGCEKCVFLSSLPCCFIKKVSWWVAIELCLIVIIIHNIICHPLCFCQGSVGPYWGVFGMWFSSNYWP